MPGRKHIWVSDASAEALRILRERWGLDSDSATIREALTRALERADERETA